MKTFGLFLLLWVSFILITFVNFQGASALEIIKMVLATQMAYVFYRLIKEELK